ncbi:glycine cleavage system protein GcvH [Phycisphaerales bacterium AB-hyl4]|uniref:Glycine cleavage system H protein n=1 Tax=Natronomicrosphaera hydrolytica TaxID=3242702 RepID=A0ABV4U3Q5_9BACT
MASTPDDRRYSKSHEWHKPEGDLVAIGISQFAVDELADITYLEITATEGEVGQGESFGEIESVKATSELYAGIAGEVVEVNQAVLDDPSIINEDPYDKGWMIKLRPSDPADLEKLMSAADYEKAASE